MYILITLIVVTIASIYYYYQKSFRYWHNKGIPYLNPTVPFGDLGKPWIRPRLLLFADFYKAFKDRGERFGGVYLFTQPILIATDPDLIKSILVKDFHHFQSRGLFFNEKKQPILANLLTIEGDSWKRLRQKLTPTFTSGKMKMMFNTMVKSTGPMMKAVQRLAEEQKAMDVKETIARFTTDVIGSCAFGIDCNSFENPNSEFRKYGVKAFQETPWKALKTIFVISCGDLAKALGITTLDKDVEQFFTTMATETYRYRKENNIKRNDFMQMLIELKDNDDDPSNSITMNELVAQVFLFFLAGFDTSSATLSFCMFNLAQHPDIQQKVREEVKHVLAKHAGEITYEGLQEMKYMDQVINETMRMYPIAPAIGRMCTEAYKLPDSDIVIEKGTRILASPWGLHRDPEFYPNPEKFDPDRFSEDNKRSIVPGTYLPFGDGPRNCIGLRFGMMQMKTCLATLLRDYEFSVNLKTTLPIELDFGFIIAAKGGIWLNIRKLS